MKISLKTFCKLIFPIIFIISGCYKPTTPPKQTNIRVVNGKNGIIQEQNGIKVTYCLLNDKGQPATVFKEGENFKFYLAIKNDIQKDTAMYIVSNFLRNSNLFSVYHNDGSFVGKPVEWRGMDKPSEQMNQLNRGATWDMKIQWHDTTGTKDSSNYENYMYVLQNYFEGLAQPMLPPGSYYTSFSQQFRLGKYIVLTSPPFNFEYISTDTLNFKINFEIK